MYTVDGFVFENEALAEIAKREEEGIRYIKESAALNNPEVVLKLYHKLIHQEVFVTVVGMRFLIELQNILLSSPQIAKDDIPPIKLGKPDIPEPEPTKPVEKVVNKIDKKVGSDYRTPFYVALFFAIVFGVSVIGMFLITKLSSNNINIINYKEEILNEYSSWEAELDEREAELKDWEKELEAREEKLNQ